MNYFRFLFVTLVLTILVLSCNRKSAPSTTVVPVLGDTLSLEINKTLTIKTEDLKLTFEKLEDSRCPKNTNCIQAGEAVAHIKMERPGVKQALKLKTLGNCDKLSVDCGERKLGIGYYVTLLNVFPYPVDNGELKPAKNAPPVVAKLVIAKRDY